MSVTVAKTAGFCFGVDRAVELVEQAAQTDSRVVTLGPIIHNRHAVERLEGLGVHVIDSPADAQAGMTVVIRSHGITRQAQQQLEEKGEDLHKQLDALWSQFGN